MLVAGGWMFTWLRRRLGEAQRARPRPAATYEVDAPLQETPVPLPASAPTTAPDDLEAINGIGATYARRLRAAGIQTFADLASRTPEELLEAAKAQPWQADPADWIAQAEDKS